ncbi:hypothetical protein [Rhizobacter sp. SG703]|uniref:hypothetical protein n=1 Tax=Rhizobacter sp. SG703 TaxID=2587140 RepID=UPI0014457E0E|nr:hypothetical protein [Rhizobacter sp. SG703]NKI97605.1 hypothetical protein [Rhizobacter sp. SG703]
MTSSVPDSFHENYRGHDLDFTPRASAGGGFVARLQVVHSFGAHRDQFSVDVGSMVFAEAPQAAQHARQAGLKWVDARVDTPS